MTDRVAIRRLPTGVPGLDQILGGGLPEFSFNLLAGAPGTGKTTLAQQIIMQRYIELKGQLPRVMAVVKVRGSAHSKDLRTFEITEKGIVMGETLGGYEGLLTGSPELVRSAPSAIDDHKPRRRHGSRPTRR